MQTGHSWRNYVTPMSPSEKWNRNVLWNILCPQQSLTAQLGEFLQISLGSKCTPYVMSDWEIGMSTLPYLCHSTTIQWRHNGLDGVSNHQPHHCLLSSLFGRRSKKTSKLCVTGLCAGNSPGTGEFPAQMASNAENVSIWWRHHDTTTPHMQSFQGHVTKCMERLFQLR